MTVRMIPLAFAAALTGTVAQAASTPVWRSVAKTEGDVTTAEFGSSMTYGDLAKSYSERFPELFAQIPTASKAHFLYRGEAKLTETTADSRKRVRTSSVILPAERGTEYLFTLTETATECIKSDCTPQTEFKLTGPQHHYSSLSEPGTPVTSLKKSFDLVITVKSGASGEEEPADAAQASLVTYQLTVLNRGYMDFVRNLHEKKLLAKMPVEREILAAFAAWAFESAKALN